MLRTTFVVALCLLGALPTVADARTTADIAVALAPDVAGSPTTITFTAAFKDAKGGVPAQIERSVTHLPPGLEVDLTGVGTCSPATMEEPGGDACPKSSLLGAGSAFAEVNLGGEEPVQEHAPVRAFLGSVRPGRTVLYFDAEGKVPVEQTVITRVTITGSPAAGQTFTIDVPPIPSSVGGPNVSVVDFKMSLGRQKVLSIHPHSRYYATVNGRRMRVFPRGIVLPRRCRGGRLSFPTKLFFQGGETLATTPTAPCRTRR